MILTQDRKKKVRQALLLGALIAGTLAALTFATPYSPFLQKAVWIITGDPFEITYCQLLQNLEYLDKKLVKCRAKIAADKSGLHLYGCEAGVNAKTTTVLIDESVHLNAQAKQWLENFRSQGD